MNTASPIAKRPNICVVCMVLQSRKSVYVYTYLMVGCMLVLLRTAMRNERWESHAYGVAAERKVNQKKSPARQKAKFLNVRLA